MGFYKIIGSDGEDNYVNLERFILVEFVEEEHLVVFDSILKIKVKSSDYRWVRKDLLSKICR